MRNFDDPIDIKQLAADLMSLNSGEFNELTKELREHWWKDFDTGDISINPSVLASWSTLTTINESDNIKKETSIKVAEWFKKYNELEEQHAEDEVWVNCVREENEFWKEFWKYINDEAVGDIERIIDAVANNDHNWFEGYVKVEKKVNDKQKILISFINNRGNKYTAEWQAYDNYAVWQTCGICGDDYSGYLLFPTYKDDEYFCIYYNC